MSMKETFNMKITQKQRILAILVEKGKIDNYSAIQSRLTYRLGARIYDLRKDGHKIKSEELPDKNCVYTLEQ